MPEQRKKSMQRIRVAHIGAGYYKYISEKKVLYSDKFKTLRQ